MQTFIHQLVREHQLGSQTSAQLWALAFSSPDAATLTSRIFKLLSVVAALLTGLGLIFWVAANWQDWGRMVKFGLLLGLLGVSALGATLLPKLRSALLLLATLFLGGLLAFVGQTYQTGADPWQLFAAWAGLALLWVLVSRSDAMWSFWVLLVAGAIALWSGNHLFMGSIQSFWSVPGIVTPCLWAALVIVSSLGARYAVELPANRPAYSQRLAVLFALIAWTTTAVWIVVSFSVYRQSGANANILTFMLSLGFVIGLGLWLKLQKRFDVPAFSMVVLACNVIILSVLARALFNLKSHLVFEMSLFGAVALCLLGLSGQWLMRLQTAQTSKSSDAMPESAPETLDAESSFFKEAQHAGLLPSNALVFPQLSTPSWLVTAMNFIGAQFAVVPMLIVFFFSVGSALNHPISGLIFGVFSFAVALALIATQSPKSSDSRTEEASHSPQGFVAQLGLSILLVGVGVMLFSKLHLFFVAMLMLGAALMIRITWIKVLIAFLAFVALANLGEYQRTVRWGGEQISDVFQPLIPYVPLLMALLWALWANFEAQLSQSYGRSSWLESVAKIVDCAAVAALITVAFNSSFLLESLLSLRGSSATGSADSELWGTASLWQWNIHSFVYALLVVALGVFLVRRWRLIGNDTSAAQRYSLVLLAMTYGCWAMLTYLAQTGLVVCLIATLALATARKRLVILAVLVLLAQLSGFYYALQWTLLQKASLLMVMGALISVGLALAFWIFAARARSTAPSDSGVTCSLSAALPWLTPVRCTLAVALGGLLCFGAVSVDVFKKEQVIAHGQKIYIPLAPRDPRSIMQGDYMALNFGDRFTTRNAQERRLEGVGDKPSVWAQLDARGVATITNAEPSAEMRLSGNLIRVPLKYKNGEWIVVTDAYYFPEGQGEPFTKTRFGEFRILPDGRALLVGMADEALNAIQPASKASKQP